MNTFFLLLVEDCNISDYVDSFSSILQMMIDSPIISSKVKAIFKRIQKSIVEYRHCLIDSDVKCLKYIFSEIALPVKQELIDNTTGAQQILFEKMFSVDSVAHAKIQPLNPNDSKEAKQILCELFEKKWDFIYEYVDHEVKVY